MLGNLDRCSKTISKDRIIAKIKVAAISSKDSVGLKDYDTSISELSPSTAAAPDFWTAG
jgi:hypothetical protein